RGFSARGGGRGGGGVWRRHGLDGGRRDRADALPDGTRRSEASGKEQSEQRGPGGRTHGRRQRAFSPDLRLAPRGRLPPPATTSEPNCARPAFSSARGEFSCAKPGGSARGQLKSSARPRAGASGAQSSCASAGERAGFADPRSPSSLPEGGAVRGTTGPATGRSSDLAAGAGLPWATGGSAGTCSTVRRISRSRLRASLRAPAFVKFSPSAVRSRRVWPFTSGPRSVKTTSSSTKASQTSIYPIPAFSACSRKTSLRTSRSASRIFLAGGSPTQNTGTPLLLSTPIASSTSLP